MRILLLLFVISALLASGCTPKETVPTPVTATPQGSASPGAPSTVIAPKAEPSSRTQAEGDAAWAKTIQDAQKEGKVIIYSFALAGDVGIAVTKAFKDKYGIKLEIVAGTSPVVLERVRAEYRAGQTMSDLVDMSVPRMLALKDDKLTQSAKDLPVLQDKASWYTHPLDLDPDGHILSYYMSISSPYINTTMVKAGEEPKSFLDLLQPRWKGKVMAGDPGVYIGTTYLYYAMVKKTNGLSEDFFRQMRGQIGKFVPGSARDQLLALIRGEGPINITTSSAGAASLVAEGAPIKAVNMKEGAVANPSTSFALLPKAPHPNAARVFLNWFLSAEGLKVFAQTGSNATLRKDVPDFLPAAARVDLSSAITLNFNDLAEIDKLYNAGYLTKLWKGEAGK